MLFVLPAVYFLLLLFFIFGILKSNNNIGRKKHKISVIVAARNEERNILSLLKSFEKQSYDEFELIIIDDRSTDNTYKIVLDYSRNANIDIKLYEINEKNSIGKKKAVELGISKAKHDILAFTDADCIVPKDWLKEINGAFDDKTDYVCGYSELIYKNDLVTYLKNIERAGYLASVAGAFGWNLDLSSAASNMAYRKKIFEQADGFRGIDKVKSGDDDLLLHKMKPYIRRLKFLLTEQSIVKSVVHNDMATQYETEKRRASKWRFYPFWIKVLTLFIFVYYIYFSVVFFYFLGNWRMWSILVILKILPEFVLLLVFLHKIKRLKYLLVFPLAELIYIPYFVFFGIKGLKGNYKWKE